MICLTKNCLINLKSFSIKKSEEKLVKKVKKE